MTEMLPEPDEYRAAARLRTGLRNFLQASEWTLHELGLTPERYELLLAIEAARHGGERLTVGDAGRVLGLAPSSATQLARRAEDAGLLCRAISTRDARVRYLRLTAAGEQRLAAAVAALRPERERLADVVAALVRS